MQIIVESDYDGYFEGLTKHILETVKNCRFSTVVVTAGPYRSVGCSVYKRSDKIVNLDFYSALRNGFGSLSKSDIDGIRELLEAEPQ